MLDDDIIYTATTHWERLADINFRLRQEITELKLEISMSNLRAAEQKRKELTLINQLYKEQGKVKTIEQFLELNLDINRLNHS